MEKTNVAGILKGCPRGMELDCTICEDVYFDYVSELNIIHCYIQYETYRTSIIFNQYGTYNSDIKSKCVIFPKGKNTWEGFVPPCQFKDGDVVFSGVNLISILKEIKQDNLSCYVATDKYGKLYIDEGRWTTQNMRFATEEEKEKLFNAIKANGYKWNDKTKNLEKLASKFDISTLVPFESRVLARDCESGKWYPGIWGYYDNDSSYPYKLIGCIARYCIPYEGNEHLRGKVGDCDKYFKTWE